MADSWGGSWGTTSAWADSWGIGLEEEVDAGIGLSTSSFPVRRPPVDFVISNGWISSNIPAYRNVIDLEARRAVRSDTSELREMMQLYSLWKKAA